MFNVRILNFGGPKHRLIYLARYFRKKQTFVIFRTDGRTDGRADGRTDGRTDDRTGGRTVGRSDARLGGRSLVSLRGPLVSP